MSSNPYAAPRAAVSDIETVQEYQEIRMWSATGRIGRLRYLAYTNGGFLLCGTAAILLATSMGVFGMILAGLIYLSMIVFSVMKMVQRSHDMNWSGWSVLLAFLPLVGLIWLFKSGAEGVNDYGAPPPPNSTAVKVLGLLLPIVLFLIGILAAIAIPAYAEYVKRHAGG